MDRNTIEERLLAHLRTRVQGRIPDSSIEAGTPLAESGILDSLGFMEFLAHLQSEFSITLGADDFRPDRIGTVAACADRILEQKVTA